MSEEMWAPAPPAPPPPPVEEPRTRARWGRRILVIFSGLLLVAGAATAGAFFGIHHERDRWQPLYARTADQVVRWKADSARWQQRSDKYQGLLKTLQTRVSTSVGDLASPHFVLWNSCTSAGPSAGCQLIPGHEYIGGVPDTFTYNLSFHADVPVTVWILSSQNFVCWETHTCAWHGIGWQSRTDLDAVFHDAEGCAGYIAVFTSDQPGTLYPNVSVTRNAASQPTGVCA
ncbi:MAG: hypothetical protein M3O88_03705 [Actinomycetota bacterium]|nr:hypothetical protein [Actinomycetota bacterium]